MRSKTGPRDSVSYGTVGRVRIGNYWHMLPEAAQARKAIWEAINPHTGRRRIDETFPMEIRASTRETDMMIEFTSGSTWQVVGSDNYNSLVGSPPVGVLYSEYALANPASWAFLRPILAENGGWAMMISTPRGPNHLRKLYDAAKSRPEWFAQMLSVKETGAIPEFVLERELRDYCDEFGEDEGKALYEQEYLCSFEAQILGSIYGSQMRAARAEDRIGSVGYDPYKPVGTMWDLGISDSTAIWFFQLDGEMIKFIDYYAMNNVGFDHYARVLKEKGYNYDRNMHIFPHDIENRELSTAERRSDTMYKLGIPPTVAPAHSVWEGINLVRRNFHRFWFDAGRCEAGIEGLTLYQREYDRVNRIFKNLPKHDFSSHPADSLRTGMAMLPDVAVNAIVQKSSDYGRRGGRKKSRPPSAMAS
jgi:phage terminase large subunit